MLLWLSELSSSYLSFTINAMSYTSIYHFNNYYQKFYICHRWFTTFDIDVSNVRWHTQNTPIWVSTDRILTQECSYLVRICLKWIQKCKILKKVLGAMHSSVHGVVHSAVHILVHSSVHRAYRTEHNAT